MKLHDDDKMNFPWFDDSLSFEKRIDLLMQELTVQEKCSLLRAASPAVPHCGIPAFNWWNEALHGVARAGQATVFPQAIAAACSFDTPLLKKVARAIAREGRAKFHAAQQLGNQGCEYLNLTYWTPNINIYRDPRWGRGQETFGEDPFLTGEMGKAMVEGLQGDDPKYLLSAACAKHFWGHSGPEALRHGFDASISKYDALHTYLPAFEKLVKEAHVEGVMGAYNRTNGEVCCGSENYIEKLLRHDWGFKGYFVSDCMAICDFYLHHHVAENMTEAAAMALKNGCNLNCGEAYSRLYEAYQKKMVSKKDIDGAVFHVLMTRMKLGLFDSEEKTPFAKISPAIVGCSLHRKLARKLASESVVLLENDGILPLSRQISSIALGGPNVENFSSLWGSYHGLSGQFVTPLEGIIQKISIGCDVRYVNSTDRHNPDILSGDPEVVIYIAGLNESLEGEGGDRDTLALPEQQRRELDDLYARGARVVLIVIAGGAVDLTEDKKHAAAILFSPYPGEQGGNALADILFGDISPSGRLPVTFPMSLADLPDFEDYSMKGRTYRYLVGKPMYSFGYGLSYTSFRYSDLQVCNRRQDLLFAFKIENSGLTKGDEVIQLYCQCGTPGYPVPNSTLLAFCRVGLKPGQEKRIRLRVAKTEIRKIVSELDGSQQKIVIRFFIGGDASLRAPLSYECNYFCL